MAGGQSAPNMCAHVHACVQLHLFVCALEQRRNVATLVCRSVPSGHHAHVRGFYSCHLPHAVLLLIAASVSVFVQPILSFREIVENQIFKSRVDFLLISCHKLLGKIILSVLSVCVRHADQLVKHIKE